MIFGFKWPSQPPTSGRVKAANFLYLLLIVSSSASLRTTQQMIQRETLLFGFSKSLFVSFHEVVSLLPRSCFFRFLLTNGVCLGPRSIVLVFPAGPSRRTCVPEHIANGRLCLIFVCSKLFFSAFAASRNCEVTKKF